MKVLLNYQKINFIILLVLLSFPSFGQDLQNDRQILIDLYESTNGANWTKNTNWLKEDESLENWYGVEVEGGRVTKIILPNNNLENEIPTSITGLKKLKSLNISGNNLTKIPDLTSMEQLSSIKCVKNRLSFDSFYENQYMEGIVFHPQQNIASVTSEIVCIGDSLILPIDNYNNAYNYTWYRNSEVVEQTLVNGDLVFEDVEITHRGAYYYEIENNEVPGLTLKRNNINIKLCDYDSLGGPYVKNQVVVQFDPSLSDAEKDTVRTKYNVLNVEDHLCGQLELWFLPDTIYLPGGGVLIIIEEITDNIREDPGVQEVDLNHLTVPEASNTTILVEELKKTSAKKANTNTTLPATVVAIIDTGIDYNHPTLAADMWQNPSETANGVDDDNNCVIDDIYGVNFVRDGAPPYDDHSHGTHVAGIVQANSVSPVELMALKTHNEKGVGDIFSMAAAIYYAQQKNVDVINMSTGYYGVENLILKRAIEAVQENDIIVVVSAGNSAKYVDTIPHFPSGHDLDNIIAVAAIDSTGSTGLAFYSNDGPITIDLAAEGTNVMATLPGGGTGMKTGTSMSAAKVTGVVAQSIYAKPNYCYKELINCIYNSVTIQPDLVGKVRTAGVLASDPSLSNCCQVPHSFVNKVISGNVVKLKWAEGNCTSFYQLIYQEQNTTDWSLVNLSSNITHLNNLSPNTGYDYIVRSICGSGYSDWSPIQSFQTGNQQCDVPDSNEIFVILPSDGTNDEVIIYWLPQGPNLLYELQYRSEDGASWKRLATSHPKVKIPIDINSNYVGRIRTQCNNGWTNWSSRFTFPNINANLKLGEQKTIIKNKLLVYPNPAHEIVNIELDEALVARQVLLKDLHGKLVRRQDVTSHQFELNLENLSAGVYFITVILENGQLISRKIIKTPL